MEIPSRRGFITGLGAIVCAPAIVRASSLMVMSPKQRILTWEEIEAAILAPMIAKLAKQISDDIFYGSSVGIHNGLAGFLSK